MIWERSSLWLSWSLAILMAAVVVGVAAAHMLGVDFATEKVSFSSYATAGLKPYEIVRQLFLSMRGGFVTTLLLWSGVSIAALTGLMSLGRRFVAKEDGSWIYGVSLVGAASLVAFELLATIHIIPLSADRRDFLPVVWTYSYFFFNFQIASGIAFSHLWARSRAVSRHLSPWFVLYTLVSVILSITWLLSLDFPLTYEVRTPVTVAGIVFVAIGVGVSLLVYRAEKTIFAFGFALSMVPASLSHLCMSLGASEAFDAYFNIAVFFKVFAFVLPFLGLTIDFLRYQYSEMLLRVASEKAERRMGDTMQIIGDGLIVTDEVGRMVRCNPSASRLLQSPARDLVGENITALVIPLEAASFREFIRSRADTGARTSDERAMELTIERRDRSKIPVEATLDPFSVRGDDFLAIMLRDISDRKELERLKKEFVANIAHDLKTPLTSIMGSTELLLMGKGGGLPEKSRSFVKRAHSNSFKLLGLINDIMKVEMLTSKHVKLDLDLVAIKDTLEESIEGIRDYDPSGSVGVETSFVGLGGVLIYCDAGRISRVMDNLLSNAIKFADAGTAVRVRAGLLKGRVRITVFNACAGMSSAQQEKVFNRYYRGEDSPRSIVAGTGLGLAISRNIVRAHGGDVWFQSEEGVGVTSFVDLPVPSEQSRGTIS